MLKDAMEQRPSERPQVQVGPIFRHSFATTAAFRKFLSSNPNLQAVASPDRSICLQNTDPFLWCRKPGGHALLFTPCHKLKLDDVETKWISHPMKEMYGTTKELFTINHNTVYYGGTYKCLPLSWEMCPDGCKDLSGLDLQALARATISDNGASHKLYQDSFQAVINLWKSNILKAECIGLQYIGFDENLYNTLVPMGRKLQGDEAFRDTRSRVDARGNVQSKRKTLAEQDDYSRKSKGSGNKEHRTKRRRE
ncbi:hypothetical protein IW261DRAFT_118623 [Armillaria novae-zelandiae]|uniref:Uncharacterized protein n=1 Tax=Armillaria novae-zelandiae TaxID=153914 RepID=A0AA39UBA2_9AGAR|nr:hypothetical protein IW261DRAFT_118623 [Armillaria novae-zelandiae]